MRAQEFIIEFELPKKFRQKGNESTKMFIEEIILESKLPPIRQQIINDVAKHGAGDYFVRFTNVDKLGFSAKQTFGRSPDVDDPAFDVDYIGTDKGRRAVWFYPLSFYLKFKQAYATDSPYIWLVKLRPDAWLQPVKSGDKKIKFDPEGKERVGILRLSLTPAAIFFKPGFELIGKYYNYAGQHKRHGEVKGPSPKTWFQRIRGY